MPVVLGRVVTQSSEPVPTARSNGVPTPGSGSLQRDIPYLPPAPAISSTFVLGAAVMLAGLALYNGPLWLRALWARFVDWINTEDGVLS